jgi:hypothetical protein
MMILYQSKQKLYVKNYFGAKWNRKQYPRAICLGNLFSEYICTFLNSKINDFMHRQLELAYVIFYRIEYFNKKAFDGFVLKITGLNLLEAVRSQSTNPRELDFWLLDFSDSNTNHREYF